MYKGFFPLIISLCMMLSAAAAMHFFFVISRSPSLIGSALRGIPGIIAANGKR